MIVLRVTFKRDHQNMRTSKGTALIPINDYKIVNESKLSSSWVWAQFPTYHTMHYKASYVVHKMCYTSKDDDSTVCAKNHTHYEVVYGSKRSTKKLANHLKLKSL